MPTPTGVLRMLEQKRPPYNNLAIFEIDHPTLLAMDGQERVPQWCAAYGTTKVGDQVIQHGFVQAGTVVTARDAAEGNVVIVTGGAVAENASKAGFQDAGLITRTIYKVDSCNFFNLPDTNPHFPDGSSPEYFGHAVPIEVVDFKLQTQEAVDVRARRIYDKACWSRFYFNFTGPMMLVTDVTDGRQVAPRRLRFYDPVQLRMPNGDLSQFLVLSCSPAYTKDSLQMANYSLVTQSNINSIAALRDPHSMLARMKKALERLMGGSIGPYNPGTSAAHNQARPSLSRAMPLPVAYADPIQDLDPSSSGFGQFYYQPGYDGLGMAPLGR